MKMISQKTYSATTGAILFFLGFFGFAFKQYVNLPESYLFFSLVLGFWGLLAAFYR